LKAIGGYERRVSHRRFAVRALDVERQNTQVIPIGQNAFFGRTKPINLEKTEASGVLVTVAPVIVCRADGAYLHGLSWCWLS
jgi:hypothetical protein